MRHPTAARLALFLLPAACCAVIIDRIIVTVGTQVISESELELAIRLTAFMNLREVDFSPQARRSTIERLIEKKLVLKELDLSKFPRPGMAEVEPLIESLIQARFHGERAVYLAALQRYGITEGDFKGYRLWLLTFFRFIDFRFRPGIQVTEPEIEEYFKTKVLPLAQQANPGKSVSIDEYHDRIERSLLVQREDQQMEVWLKDQRARTRIEYRDPTLQPEPQRAEAGK